MKQIFKVKCPNCKRTDFVTTDKYNPDVQPNGSMVKCLLPYHIDWLCSSATYAAQMTCPECTCQLAPYGRLTVIPDMMVPEGAQIIDKPLPTPDGPITTPFTSDGNPTPAPVEEAAPEANPKEAPNPLVCDVCGKECKNQFGLNSHKRSHK